MYLSSTEECDILRSMNEGFLKSLFLSVYIYVFIYLKLGVCSIENKRVICELNIMNNGGS